jgi:hypothetical protein
MQNFKPGYIHGHDKSKPVKGGRPYRGEVRWYGATDNGLIDVRPNVLLWGTQKETKRFEEIKKATDCMLSDLEIAEKVLAEDWPKKEREDHERYIHSKI